MHDLALAVLIGLAIYGVVNVIGDVHDFIERHRTIREPLASIHDFEAHRRALRSPRSLP